MTQSRTGEARGLNIGLHAKNSQCDHGGALAGLRFWRCDDRVNLWFSGFHPTFVSSFQSPSRHRCHTEKHHTASMNNLQRGYCASVRMPCSNRVLFIEALVRYDHFSAARIQRLRTRPVQRVVQAVVPLYSPLYVWIIRPSNSSCFRCLEKVHRGRRSRRTPWDLFR